MKVTGLTISCSENIGISTLAYTPASVHCSPKTNENISGPNRIKTKVGITLIKPSTFTVDLNIYLHAPVLLKSLVDLC